MKCPHCLQDFHATVYNGRIYRWHNDQLIDADGLWDYRVTVCPACSRSTIWLRRHFKPREGDAETIDLQVWPKGIPRSALFLAVPEQFATDYREACLVLADSPKASAALSRRCLQHLLREHVKVKPGTLSTEIDQALAAKTLPSDLAGDVDAIRNVGNFAAHPEKDTKTGEIIEVEPGEAEWLLDVLEGLFDVYFVRPAERAAKREALNQKLKGAGKPPMK